MVQLGIGEEHFLTREDAAGYLDRLRPGQITELTRVNKPGLAALRGYLASSETVAFLGAGASAPLYPLWNGLIGELIDAAADRLSEQEAETCRALASSSPEEVVEIVRRFLGTPIYREVLREVLRVRVAPESGRSWTAVQELVCRCAFKAVVTTNYDPGVVDARMRVRSTASATGFMSWDDELGLDRWRTGDVFRDAELPVLFAHGQHNRPDSVVLATTEYRRAYAGKLSQVLARLMDGHLVWIGFSFADQRIAAILREVADQTGTRVDPGIAPRHVAIMAWDPAAEGNDPHVLVQQAELAYGAQLVLYPAPDGDHSALPNLLSMLTDDRFPPTADLPASTVSHRRRPGAGVVMQWAHEAEPAEFFTGRAEELVRLGRWAADLEVALVGLTAWGGAGKTALVTHWIQEEGGAAQRSGVRGVFVWSFYAEPSSEQWASELLNWGSQFPAFQRPRTGRLADAVLRLLRAVPLMLVLDGLEGLQEGPAGAGFGRLLDGTLREVLVGACQVRHGGLVLLTSRFPFADLEGFDGGRARMLDVPPFRPDEGSDFLAAAGGGWLPDGERRDLVRAVDGHALATGVLAGLLAARPPVSELAALRAELAPAARTDVRVRRVLRFYADRLSEPDRYLLAAVSLFPRPVSTGAVLAIASHNAFGSRLAGWTPRMVEAAVRDRLRGLLTWYPDGTISAHPLVRDTFRTLAMGAAGTAVEVTLTGIPSGTVTSRTDALRVVEAIELLVDAGQWRQADSIYRARCGNGEVWKHLPAARLGERAAIAFVASPTRRADCVTHLRPPRLGYYLNEVGLCALDAGDVVTAQDFLTLGVRHAREMPDPQAVAVRSTNLAACLAHLGETGPAQAAAAHALTWARYRTDREKIRSALAYMGWVATLAGDAAEADKQFAAADRISVFTDQEGGHLYSFRGARWAEWLTRTGRLGPAKALTSRNAEISRRHGWNEDVARCDWLLGSIALAEGDTITAGEHLAAAAEGFRDGDYLTELTTTLRDQAEYARAIGDLEQAERHVVEAISIAGSRGLLPAHSAALAARARIRADQASKTGDPDAVSQGRDAADAARRLAARHHLPWHEFDALRAHALLDQAEGTDYGWEAQADALYARLRPASLDPDPLATVEQELNARRDGMPD